MKDSTPLSKTTIHPTIGDCIVVVALACMLGLLPFAGVLGWLLGDALRGVFANG